MTSDLPALAKALGPRATIRSYLARLAARRRQAGLVPMNGRWVSLEKRTAELGKAQASSRIILIEIIVLLGFLAGTSLLLLLLTCYLAY